MWRSNRFVSRLAYHTNDGWGMATCHPSLSKLDLLLRGVYYLSHSVPWKCPHLDPGRNISVKKINKAVPHDDLCQPPSYDLSVDQPRKISDKQSTSRGLGADLSSALGKPQLLGKMNTDIGRKENSLFKKIKPWIWSSFRGTDCLQRETESSTPHSFSFPHCWPPAVIHVQHNNQPRLIHCLHQNQFFSPFFLPSICCWFQVPRSLLNVTSP